MAPYHAAVDEPDYWPGTEPEGASQRVYLGIMQDLEARRLVPGQRLIETELATRFAVGRNAVREAIQRLAVRGVVDLNRHKSSSIRQLDALETMEVLDVASAMTALLFAAAARRFDQQAHGAIIADIMDDLAAIDNMSEPGMFSRARRRFYRSLLSIGGNRELRRLFPAIGMHIIYSQFQSPRLQEIRLADYWKVCDFIIARDADAAAQAGREHVENIRAIILQIQRR